MTCKDCVHYGLCKYQSTLMVEDSCLAEQCADFKDYSRFIELAYKTGDIVYLVLDNKIFSDVITSIAVGNGEIVIYTALYSFQQKEIGAFVFLTQEEAEQALKVKIEERND